MPTKNGKATSASETKQRTYWKAALFIFIKHPRQEATPELVALEGVLPVRGKGKAR